MTLEELLTLKNIRFEEYEIYLLFAMSEAGQKWLKRNTMQTFMDQPSPIHSNGETYAYAEGRRSMLRDIHETIEKINILLEKEDDGRDTDPSN